MTMEVQLSGSEKYFYQTELNDGEDELCCIENINVGRDYYDNDTVIGFLIW